MLLFFTLELLIRIVAERRGFFDYRKNLKWNMFDSALVLQGWPWLRAA